MNNSLVRCLDSCNKFQKNEFWGVILEFNRKFLYKCHSYHTVLDSFSQQRNVNFQILLTSYLNFLLRLLLLVLWSIVLALKVFREFGLEINIDRKDIQIQHGGAADDC